MPFFGNTLPASYGFAKRFAGKGGRVATLPDIMSLRAATGEDKIARVPWINPWQSWFDTTSAEYMGFTAGGVPIIIVAHGVGPLATAAGIKRIYRRRESSLVYGRCTITWGEFRKLEAGVYDDVSIVPLQEVMGCYEVPFYEASTLDQAAADPLLQARLGPAWRQVMVELDKVTRNRDLRYTGGQPKLVANLGNLYELHMPDDPPQAHLLTVGRTVVAHRGNDNGGTSISFDVDLVDRVRDNRFIGVKPGWDGRSLHGGPYLLNDPTALRLIISSGRPELLDTDYITMMDVLGQLEVYQRR